MGGGQEKLGNFVCPEKWKPCKLSLTLNPNAVWYIRFYGVFRQNLCGTETKTGHCIPVGCVPPTSVGAIRCTGYLCHRQTPVKTLPSRNWSRLVKIMEFNNIKMLYETIGHTAERLDLTVYYCTIREGELTEEEKALREYELSYTKPPIASLHNLGKITFF